MKTSRIIAIAATVMALAACTKEQGYNESSFKKGQVVTLNVTAGASATKVTSELNGTNVDFKWEAGDKIKVTVNSSSAEFTLSSGAGTSTATFTGTMPADGEAFDVQYPYDTPDLATQTYSSTEALPHDKMLLAAENCPLSEMSFELKAQYAALRLNLYGGARSVSKIVVTNTDNSDTYTLTCSPAKVVGKDKDSATTFFVIVPVGTGSWSFSAAVTAAEETSTADNTVSYESLGLGTIFSLASTTFSPASAQKFTAGEILNMPAKSLTTVWAPVNCGYDATHTYGSLYQWGRKYGQYYEAGQLSLTVMTKSDDTAANSGNFGKYNGTDNNWFSGGVDNTLWNGSSKGTSDPCPDGWRVPTGAEFNALISQKAWGMNTVGTVSQTGYWFNGSSTASVGTGVFLPAAGVRYYSNGKAATRSQYGQYWSSSPGSSTTNYARYMGFDSSTADMQDRSRADGYSVRCVQE